MSRRSVSAPGPSARRHERRNTMTAPLSASEIVTLGHVFMDAKVLLVAVKLRLFDELQDTPLTGTQIRERLGLHPRAIPDFPDALVALGVLARDGDGPGARYANTPAGAHCLVRGRDAYVGGILELYNERTLPLWDNLEEALRTGAPQNETKHNGRPIFDELYRDPAALEQFVAAMSGISRPNFKALAEVFDFGPYRTLCDVGGSAAELCCAVAARHAPPALHVIRPAGGGAARAGCDRASQAR